MCCLIVALGFDLAQRLEDQRCIDLSDWFSSKITVGELQVVFCLIQRCFGLTLDSLFLKERGTNFFKRVAFGFQFDPLVLLLGLVGVNPLGKLRFGGITCLARL